MSQDNSDEWVSTSGESGEVAKEEGSDEWVSTSDESGEANEPGEGAQQNTATGSSGSRKGKEAQLSFEKKTQEEVVEEATATRRRSSSLSEGLANLSVESYNAALPPQPPPSPPHVSKFPHQFKHGPEHDRTRSPKSNLPDYHDPESSTQRRGPGVPRNPVSDTWRDDAYEKKKATMDKIIDPAKMQDRWKCEYCNHFNDRGITDVIPPVKTRKKESGGVSKHATQAPIPIPNPPAPGVGPGEQVKCAYCGEQMFAEMSRYDPREMAEDGVRWDQIEQPDNVKNAMKEVAGVAAHERVQERWEGDRKRSIQELEEQKRKKSIADSVVGGGEETRKAEEEGEEESESESPLDPSAEPQNIW